MNRFPFVPGRTYRLILKPEDFDTTEQHFIDGKYLVPISCYNLLKVENGTLGSCLERLEDGLLANFQKNRRIKASLRDITNRFHKLVELKEDRMSLALRRMEVGVLKLSRTMDRIVEDFQDSGMNPDQFKEAMILLASIIDDLEPEHCLGQLFADVRLEDNADANKNL